MIPVRRVLCFLGFAVAIHALLSFLYLRTAGLQHRAWQLDEAFLTDDSPLELLIVGDSHARNAFDARRRASTASIAIGGEHYIKTAYRLGWLLERTERPVRAVALPYDITSFTSWKADHFAPEAIWGRYVPLLQIGIQQGEPWSFAGKALKAKLAPYAGEAETLVQFARGTRAFRVEHGQSRFDAVGPRVRMGVAMRAVKNHFQEEIWVDPRKDQALQELVRRLQARGSTVVLVSYPLSEEYLEVARRVGIYPEVRAHMRQRAESMPGVVWLDHEQLYAGRTHLFFDADHLNGAGRNHFTGLLVDQLVARGVLDPEAVEPLPVP